jgi:hypothetical protein
VFSGDELQGNGDTVRCIERLDTVLSYMLYLLYNKPVFRLSPSAGIKIHAYPGQVKSLIGFFTQTIGYPLQMPLRDIDYVMFGQNRSYCPC